MSKPFAQAQKTKGQILKDARTIQGITLESIHEITKIPLDVLRAIEEGYTVRTLSSFYLKGFIKMYAQYLGVDISKILDEDPVSAIVEQPIRVRNKGPVKTQQTFPQFFTKKRQQLLFRILGTILALVILFKIGGWVYGGIFKKGSAARTQAAQAKEAKKKADSVKPVTSTKEKTTTTVKTVRTKPVEQSAQEAKSKAETPVEVKNAAAAEGKKTAVIATPVPPPAVIDRVDLTVKAKKRGWLQVKVDGNLVFQSTIKEGDSEVWHAKEMIEISGKNINNLEFELNGKILGSLGREDRSARRVVVTKDGLSVKK